MLCRKEAKCHWIFPDQESINKIRKRTNDDYVKEFTPPEISNPGDFFLSAEEEFTLFCYYQHRLRAFCAKCEPPLPRAVAGTAMNYFKKFYLFNSLMNYHPKEIIVACVYLACKIEDSSISVAQFVTSAPLEDQARLQDVILSNEATLLTAVNFDLDFESIYQPVEEFLIDLKIACKELNVDVLRPAIEEFLDLVLMTDVPLLYSPSQIVLAALVEAGRKCQMNTRDYVTETLITDEDLILPVAAAIQNIIVTVQTQNYEPLKRDIGLPLEMKLSNCRNPQNNPASDLYKFHKNIDTTKRIDVMKKEETDVVEQRKHFTKLIREHMVLRKKEANKE